MAELLKIGYEVYPITFKYGQRHGIETDRLIKIITWFRKQTVRGALRELEIMHLPQIKCLLTDVNKYIPEGNVDREGVAPTYVPGRNLIFIAHALSYAEIINAYEIFIGVNAVDYSGYPDCRPEFIAAMNMLSEVANSAGIGGNPIKIVAPLMKLTKAQIIKKGMGADTPYHLTWSCYVGGPNPCGECDSCKLRAKGFKEVGEVDPAHMEEIE